MNPPRLALSPQRLHCPPSQRPVELADPCGGSDRPCVVSPAFDGAVAARRCRTSNNVGIDRLGGSHRLRQRRMVAGHRRDAHSRRRPGRSQPGRSHSGRRAGLLRRGSDGVGGAPRPHPPQRRPGRISAANGEPACGRPGRMFAASGGGRDAMFAASGGGRDAMFAASGGGRDAIFAANSTPIGPGTHCRVERRGLSGSLPGAAPGRCRVEEPSRAGLAPSRGEGEPPAARPAGRPGAVPPAWRGPGGLCQLATASGSHIVGPGGPADGTTPRE